LGSFASSYRELFAPHGPPYQSDATLTQASVIASKCGNFGEHKRTHSGAAWEAPADVAARCHLLSRVENHPTRPGESPCSAASEPGSSNGQPQCSVESTAAAVEYRSQLAERMLRRKTAKALRNRVATNIFPMAVPVDDINLFRPRDVTRKYWCGAL
jgi:hypothetical protein